MDGFAIHKSYMLSVRTDACASARLTLRRKACRNFFNISLFDSKFY